MEREKDTMVKFKSVDMKKNSKGGDYIILKLTSEEADVLAKELTEKKTERGIRLDVHVNEKESNDGRAFLSAITFVKGIQEFGANPPPRRDTSAVAPATKSAIEKLKQSKA